MNRLRNYFKKEKLTADCMTTEELLAKYRNNEFKLSKSLKICTIIAVIFVTTVVLVGLAHNSKELKSEDVTITYVPNLIATVGQKTNLISIPAGTVKANPFLPYRNIGGTDTKVYDVPQFELIAPPETLNTNSDAARVMDTIVSGIMYDKFSPTAILNIEGNDYLVKKGDVVNNYKILNISQNSVSVKLGNNTYNAGIGEILTEGTINYNTVSNLNKKFGGEKR